ncbi:MAG TPA: tRNA lysidine(34) synthetase TilS [Bacillota bacterium]|nr:tRNA lysidine(34) synthetase TilS [Bacillota bacterium]
MQKVEQFIEKHSLIKNNTTILVAVSGGPDSVALLHYLSNERQKRNIQVIALTVDHQLRQEADQEVIYVEQLCQKLDIHCVQTKIDVKTYQAEQRLSTQVAARELRYQFFRQQMNHFQADYLALGHHADDQLETMLMSFTRSTSPMALSGIPIKRPFATGFIIRPFLCLTKEAIHDYCQKHELHPMIDPSNEDLSYTRNYFRKQIAPLLKEQNVNIYQTLQRLSESLQEDEKYLAKQAKNKWQSIVTVDRENKRITFKRQQFLKHPNALQRRMYHLILNYLYDELPKQLTYVHAESFQELLMNDKSYVQINFPQQLIIEKSYDDIQMYFKEATSNELFIPKKLDIPGEVTFSDGSILRASYGKSDDVADEFTHIVTVSIGDLPLYVRGRKPGDRMSWDGLAGRKKIKDIFIDEKIPHDQRDHWPIVVTNNDEIVWLIGLKKGQLQKVAVDNKCFIKLTYKQY